MKTMKTMKKMFSLLLALALSFTLVPTIGAKAADTNAMGQLVITGLDGKIKVNTAHEFTVGVSGAPETSQPMVLTKFEITNRDNVKVEYYETNQQAGEGWHDFPSDVFGPPETGYPLMDLTSKFRVTFSEAGTVHVKLTVFDKSTNVEYMTAETDVTCVECLHEDVTPVSEKAATCTEAGNKEYWKCETCGKYYSDAECTNEITENDTVEAATGHKAVKVEAKAATCTEAGNKEYWKCETCGKYYSDAGCTTEITENDTVVAATGHKAVKVEAKAATCTEAGNKEYWKCETCGKYYSDAGCTAEIAEGDTVVPAGHDAVKVEAKEPTCIAAGNIAYWYCANCKKYYSDEELTTEVQSKDVIIAAAGHKAVKVEAKAATATEAGNIEYWKCEACGKYYSDEALTKEITEDDTVIPATGENTEEPEEPEKPEEGEPEEPATPPTSTEIKDISEEIIADNVKVVIDGEETEIKVEVKPITDAETVKEMDDKDFVANVVEATKDTELGKKLLEEESVYVIGGIDLTATIPEGKKADINVGKIEGIKAGDVVYALHKTIEGWEVLSVDVLDDGSVVIKDVTSTSPFIFVRGVRADEKTPTPEVKPNDPEKTPTPEVKPADPEKKPADPAVVPETGDNSSTVVWAMLVALSLATVVMFVGRRKKSVK